ncbi:MAG: helix-turn-helix domain-containing protein [Planctomycetaceae bacterium]|nr:helix-turn-helix domain-containing protein [Planctomycetaceae bacterium]
MKQIVVRSPEVLGGAIRDARRALGWTQAQLAEKVQMRQPMVSNIERGVGPMSLPTLLALLSALQLDVVVMGRDLARPPAPWEREER